MDILQPLPLEKWTSLREMTEENWPIYAHYYNWVTNAIKWKKKDPHSKVEIFCPNGNHNSGVFIGIFSAGLHTIAVFTKKHSKDLLKKVLLETRVIEWNQKVLFFGAVYNDFSDVLLSALTEKNRTFRPYNSYNYFKPKEKCIKMDYQVPDECKLGPLDLSHIELICSLWPHRLEDHPELSLRLLKSYITENKGLGLFLKKDDSLVSWILVTEWGGLGLLQTVEEHKRKGYGKIVTKAMIKMLAEEENLDSVLFVVEHNVASRKLFESLGFAEVGKNTWVFDKS